VTDSKEDERNAGSLFLPHYAHDRIVHFLYYTSGTDTLDMIGVETRDGQLDDDWMVLFHRQA
jgi:hypothetical protein